MSFAGICWYCHWGWAEPVALLHQEYVDRLGGDDSPLHYGIGHIVWEDENFETEHIQSCINSPDCDRYSPEENALVRESLHRLLEIPDEVRCCCPEGYDGEHPEAFPPPAGLTMIR